MALYTDFRRANTTVTDAAAINNAIKNILLTRKGSLPGKPEFGSRIEEVLFSQIDSVTKGILARYIKEALARWEKRIIVVDVGVEAVPEYNKVIATISYIYRDKGLDVNEQISVALTQ
jgi:phage baseplate assembly protein W